MDSVVEGEVLGLAGEVGGSGEGEGDGNGAFGAEGELFSDDDALAEVDGFVDVVGDDDEEAVPFLPEGMEEVVHALPGVDIEGGEGFVEEDDLGFCCEAASEGEAFAHTAGEFGGVLVFVASESDVVEELVDLEAGVGGLGGCATEEEVLAYGAPGEGVEVLEGVAESWGGAVHGLAFEEAGAGLGVFESG